MLGDKLTVVNGDKPLVRIQDGKIFAYGTPWSGKENMHSNVRTELKKVCFLKRSETNNCLPVSKQDVFEKLMVQIYRPKNLEQLMKILNLLGTFIERTEFYTIMCNTQPEAAETAYKGLME